MNVARLSAIRHPYDSEGFVVKCGTSDANSLRTDFTFVRVLSALLNANFSISRYAIVHGTKDNFNSLAFHMRFSTVQPRRLSV